MNATFQTKDLLDSFKAIRSIITKGPTGKGSNHDLLVASKKNGSVTLESVNDGLYVKYELKAEVAESGKVVIDRNSISGLKLRSSSTSLSFKEGASKLKFKSANFDGDLGVTQNFDDVESGRPMKIPDVVATVPASLLRSGIKRVMFTSNDQSQDVPSYGLGLTIRFKGKRMIMTANDSYRASMFTAELEEAIDLPVITFPASFIASVIGIIPADTVVQVGVNDSYLRVVGDGLDVCHPALQDLREVDIESNVKSMVKAKPMYEFDVDVTMAKESVDSVASIVPSSFDETIKMGVSVSPKGYVTVKVDSAIGAAKDKFVVENLVVNEEASIRVDSSYIAEFLSLIGDGKAKVSVLGKPIMIYSEDYGTTLVMPQLSDN